MHRKGPAYKAYLKWIAELKEKRLALGLTQEDVASRIRYSRTRYGALEKGESVLNFMHLYNLAEAFDVSMSDMLTLKIPKNRKKLFHASS